MLPFPPAASPVSICAAAPALPRHPPAVKRIDARCARNVNCARKFGQGEKGKGRKTEGNKWFTDNNLAIKLGAVHLYM